MASSQASAQSGMRIRPCQRADFSAMLQIINDAAQAYRGVIPADCWREPYMPKRELQNELASGVVFWGSEQNAELVGVMGLQDVHDVSLIRHAYVRTVDRRRGIGAALLAQLRALARKPILVGTWAAATWAIAFYEKHGFALIGGEEKNRLLRKYWSIPERQVDTSVVLADLRRPN